MHIPQTEVILRHKGTELAHVTLPPGDYVIGRNPEVDIRADTELLSRQHARLTINSDHLLIEDLGSSNGTFVANRPVTESTRLFPNQAIRLGDVQLEVRRQRELTESDVSLASAQAAIRRFVPDELLAEKRYAIGSQVARGGMGAILDAQQAAMKRRVAMKVMLDSADPGEIGRFVDEAQITGQLEHPNIVPVHELGVDEQGQLFYTMKFVRGVTLKEVLALLADGVEATVKKYPLPALLTIFQKACDAIAFAHSKGVIHRDLKPENIMLGDFGEVLVMDWGLAKVLAGKDEGGAERSETAAGAGGATMKNEENGLARSLVESARSAPDTSSLIPRPSSFATMEGSIMGTPHYMSPEQARGEVETLDVRSDVYALGAILFDMLFLRPPANGPDAMAIVEKVQRGAIEWPSAKEMRRAPRSLFAVCRKALALDRAARYPRVEELQADILAFQNGFATSAERAGLGKQIVLALKRHRTIAIAAALVLLAGLGFATNAVVEGRRAAIEIAGLRRQAPALRQLAESEADLQRFNSALDKLDAALALDPAHLPSYWRRAWLFIGMERLGDASAAIRLAQQKDPGHRELAAILPTIEKLAALPRTAHWPAEGGIHIYEHLMKVGASGEAASVSRKLRLAAKDRETPIRQ